MTLDPKPVISVNLSHLRFLHHLKADVILKSEGANNQCTEKITFKVVLSYAFTNQKLSFDMFTVGNSLNTFMEHDLYLIS